jgi:phosphoenolpyruvate synthase/pyruvate phosphate dikinase
LGGKGANLAEMIRIGIPVPPGFTITTEAVFKSWNGKRAVDYRNVAGISHDMVLIGIPVPPGFTITTAAVFKSWNGKRAVDYRNVAGISHDMGTAVSIVTMVFGSMGNDSATGVAMTLCLFKRVNH